MKRLLLFLLILFVLIAKAEEKPKLVVVIVLDQVPYEYITRFEPYFGEGGFRYFLKNGANFTNCQYPYAYTKTACGHAAIATGTNPSVNGIVGNAWYDRGKKKRVVSVEDDSVQQVGGSGNGRSPKMLLVNTFGDMLLQKNPRSKVIGISYKDRSAILMAGKIGTAYWVDDSLVVTSTYYMKELPTWVSEFNKSGIFQKYFGQVWDELLPDVAKKICDDDDVPYEADAFGFGRAFPYKIWGTDSSRITASYYHHLTRSPFSAEILLELSKRAIEQESLGTRNVTDVLCLSISSIDEVGHGFGPNSREVFDMMLRTDNILSEFLSFLDKKFGLKNCLIALSADHGIAPIPEYKHKVEPDLETARITSSEISSRANRMLNNTFGEPTSKWIANVTDAHIYLNEDAVLEKGIPLDVVRMVLKDSLTDNFPIDKAYTSDDMVGEMEEGCFCKRVKRSFYPPRSGDVMVLLKPFSIIDGSPDGTNHGMPYSYDAHVPLMFAGEGIKKGEYNSEVTPLDLAPTIAKVLGVEMPKECEGNILYEIVEK
jgi:predicted AlkP superfamily pyrophosphatase or phosphodiesterase